jgi:hypothetical protein
MWCLRASRNNQEQLRAAILWEIRFAEYWNELSVNPIFAAAG